jgi:signal transduction histidine kinase/HPt (histidine-containing phosphotransfer) domain-containing protein
MSHEIRTPMTAILGYTDLLMDPALSPSSRNNHLAVIRRSGEHLLSLINDILDLSKIEAGKLSLEMQRCSIVSLLADVTSMMRPRAEQRGVSLSVEYAGEMPETILTDGARLQQAIVNLVGNAVKFTDHGSVRITASFLTQCSGNQPAVRIEVSDTGIGIRQEILPQLFQPFTQGDASISQTFGGTGLGLAISRQIAYLLGGDLTVTSVLGQGSTFTLTVPAGSLEGIPMLGHPAEAMQENAGHELESPIASLKGIRILLAEDGYDNRKLIETILRLAGANVASVENGRLAVDKLEAESFDVVLMDINMPEMDGYEATRLLRDRGYDKPILALTANAMEGDSERCLAAGCDEHLAKPIDRARLLSTIAAHVGKRTVENKDQPPPTMETPPEDGAIVSQFANDPEIATILEEFVGHLEDQADAMRRAYADGRYEDLQRCAHRLKGAGGSYGYPSLTDANKRLEDAAKARDRAAADAALDTVAELIRAIQNGYSAETLTGRT